MAGVHPFTGVRFDPTVVGDLDAVTAPPYDAIDARTQARLYAASPHNVIRLELARAEGTEDPYTATRSCYERWITEGVLRPDRGPALYPYTQRTAGPDPIEQRGVLAAIDVAPWLDAVLPHERVYEGPAADRLALLEALHVNVSPVFVLAEHGAAETRAVHAAATGPPLVDSTDLEGTRHRLWRVDDAPIVAAFRAAMAGQRLLMADGHHRYTAAQRATAAGLAGSDRILAFVVPIEDGPSIRPMHRLLRHATTPRTVAGWEAATADLPVRVAPQPHGGAAASPRADALARVLVAEGELTLVVTDPGQLRETLHAAARGGAHLDPADLDLPVGATRAGLLHGLLHVGLGLPVGIEHVEHTPDVARVRTAVADGSAAAGVVTHPVPLEEVARVAASGQRLPQKSTSFHPKPRTGLVLRPLDAEPRGVR